MRKISPDDTYRDFATGDIRTRSESMRTLIFDDENIHELTDFLRLLMSTLEGMKDWDGMRNLSALIEDPTTKTPHIPTVTFFLGGYREMSYEEPYVQIDTLRFSIDPMQLGGSQFFDRPLRAIGTISKTSLELNRILLK